MSEKERLQTLTEALSHALDMVREMLIRHPHTQQFDADIIKIRNDMFELRGLVALERELQEEAVEE